MDSRLQLPHEPKQPPAEVFPLLEPYDLGRVLDSGPVRSQWSSGQIVLTVPGIVVCDLEQSEVVGIRWQDVNGEALSRVSAETQVIISLESDDAESVDLTVDGALAANMGALALKLAEIDLSESEASRPAAAVS